MNAPLKTQLEQSVGIQNTVEALKKRVGVCDYPAPTARVARIVAEVKRLLAGTPEEQDSIHAHGATHRNGHGSSGRRSTICAAPP